MTRKKNYKIYVECMKESASISIRLEEKTLLATVTSLSNAYVCVDALKQVYKIENWKITIE